MIKSYRSWQLVRQSLEQKVPVMLLYVLESKGSSPGRQGFFMAVAADGKMEGSIGGGIMEHKFVEMAKERLKEQTLNGNESHIKKQIHDKAAGANQSGMICSGEQTILLYSLSTVDLPIINNIITSLENSRNGSLQFSPAGMSFSNQIPAKNYDYKFISDEEWLYEEKTGYRDFLFVIGGGHCSLAFSKLMRELGFYITIYEEREGLHTLSQNDAAHEIIIVDDYTGLSNLIPSGPGQYVVIMTFGYRSDDIALRALIDKPFQYLGVLGSKTKMEKLFTSYREENISETLLQRIKSPIGLEINSRTPEEIAISIAAEIIAVKNKDAD